MMHMEERQRFDSYGKISSIYVDGKVAREYSYDALDRVAAIKDYAEPGSENYTLKSYTYDALGNVVTMTYLENGDESKVIESFEYAYDKAGNITGKTYVNSKLDTIASETTTYTYDSYGRLKKSIKETKGANENTKETEYTYDEAGNRLTESVNGKVTSYTYNGLHQLTAEDRPDAEIEYSYDARGNESRVTNVTEGYSTNYSYLVSGEMTKAEKEGSSGEIVFTQENEYNQDGIRISKKEGGSAKYYYYDRGSVASTKSGSDITSCNVIGIEGNAIGTVRDEENTEKYYVYNKDIQGSTISITAEDGSIAACYDYSDFGVATEREESSIENEICYTGAIYDATTSLYYMNARYYDPSIGRFISEDSYRGEDKDYGQWHLYAYCANNLINYVDPSGHSKIISMFGYEITKAVHYSRNKYNTGLPQTGKKAVKYGWDKQSAANSACHQFHSGKYPNRKYLSKNGHKEAVYYGNSDNLVVNEEDKGTYNFGTGKGMKHGVLDVAPYMLWGNSKNDKTNMGSRVLLASKEIRSSVWKKIKKKLGL